MTWEPYEPYVAPCSGGPMPGTAALAAALLDTWDIAWSLGIYNCRPPSIHSDGRAFDMALPMIDGRANPIGYQVIARVEAVSAQLGVQEAIFDRLRWSLNYPDGIYYGGVSPHYDHIHFSQTKAAAAALTYTEAIRLLATDDDGGDWLDMADIEEVKAAVRAVLNEGTGAGQESWASTSKATLATTQGLVNLARAEAAALAEIKSAGDAAKAEVLAAIEAIPAGGPGGGASAAEVADEFAARLTS